MKLVKSTGSIPKLQSFQNDDLRTSKSPRSARRTENFIHQERYLQATGKLSSYLMMQLDFMDITDLSSSTTFVGELKLSFLAKTVEKIKDIDGNFVQSIMSDEPEKVENILQQLVQGKEIEIRDGIIFSKRGAPKNLPYVKEETRSRRSSISSIKESRRISFASTKFFDGDLFLTVSRLQKMSDLDFLMSLNGYHLPFYEDSTSERSMYEYFFSSFLDNLIGKLHVKNENGDVLSCQEYGYLVLQECIFQIHMVTEFWISTIECILEIVSIINVRIELTKRGSGVSLTSLKEAFCDDNKIFNDFKSRKLLKSVVEDDQWKDRTKSLGAKDSSLQKIEKYSEALYDALKLYAMNCSAFLTKLSELRDIGKKQLDAWEILGDLQSPRQWEQDQYIRLVSFINDVIIYIGQFESFLKDVENDEGFYETTLSCGLSFLKELEEGSKDSTPRTPTLKPAEGVFAKILGLWK